MNISPDYSDPNVTEWLCPGSTSYCAVKVVNLRVYSYKYPHLPAYRNAICTTHGQFESREEAEHFAQMLFDTGAWQ